MCLPNGRRLYTAPYRIPLSYLYQKIEISTEAFVNYTHTKFSCRPNDHQEDAPHFTLMDNWDDRELKYLNRYIA